MRSPNKEQQGHTMVKLQNVKQQQHFWCSARHPQAGYTLLENLSLLLPLCLLTSKDNQIWYFPQEIQLLKPGIFSLRIQKAYE